jgi:mevalonate kinase
MDAIRLQLEKLLEQATSDAERQAHHQLAQATAELAEREQAVAAAMELATVDHAVQRAFNDGICEERTRVLKLIEVQQGYLKRGGVTHLGLTALRRAIEGEPWPMP